MKDEQGGESCGAPCRFVYYMVDGQYELAKAEFDAILMSPALSALASQLASDNAGGSDDPQAVFGDDLPGILEHGFVGEDIGVLQLAMRNPACLMNLNYLLFVEGGKYWELPVTDADRVATEVSLAKLLARLKSETAAEAPAAE